MPVSRTNARTIGAVAAVATLVLSVQSAIADVPELQLAISFNGEDGIVLTPDGTEVGSGLFNYNGSWLDPLGQYEVSWNLNANPDPLISGNLVVENLTNATQQFGLMVTLPTTMSVGPQLMGGSAAIGLTTNSDGGSLHSLLDTPVWQAMIDGSTVASLFPDEFELANSGTGSNSASANFGLPIPSAPAPPPQSSIGLDINFTLTSQDQASITSVFVVTPAPGGLAIFGLAVCGTRRRRRH